MTLDELVALIEEKFGPMVKLDANTYAHKRRNSWSTWRIVYLDPVSCAMLDDVNAYGMGVFDQAYARWIDANA